MRRESIGQLLPLVYQLGAAPGSPLDAALWVMDDLHAPVEQALADVGALFDPYRCPAPFVPWLAGWVGLGWLVDPGRVPGDTDPADWLDAFPPGLARLREVVALGSVLAQWRGTEIGLILFLRAATGLNGFTVTQPPDRPFHLVVDAPAEAGPWAALVERIVAETKPASTTAEVRVAGRPVAAPGTPPPDTPSSDIPSPDIPSPAGAPAPQPQGAP